MTERLISRRKFGTSMFLLGTAYFLMACEKITLPVNPSVKPTQKPEVNPTPIIIAESSNPPTQEPSSSQTPEPTFKPTSKPISDSTSEPNVGKWIKYKGPQVVWHGDENKRNVYLTMDDGWNASNMETALRIANDNGIKMTFCPVGKLISKNPGMYKEIVAEGHDVQNHTFTHTRLDTKTKEQIKKEVLKARDALWNAVGFEYPQSFLRPPGEFGVNGEAIWKPIFDATEELGYKVLVWDISSAGTSFGAYNAEPQQIVRVEKNVENHMHNGGISLQHAINVDVAAFPHIVSFVKRKGWNPITIRQGLG